MDYQALIDAQTWAFIHKTATFYADRADKPSAVDQRAEYDAMCAAFHQGYPDGVTATDRDADGVPARVYHAGDPGRSVVYFHGGGGIVGGLHSHDDICAEICAHTGFRVVSVDYRLSPEHTHPAAFDDAWTATSWALRKYGDDLVLAGDSAGANLAAAVAHFARGRTDKILGVVLVYPGLGGDVTQGSYVDHAHAPMLTTKDVLYYRNTMVTQTDPGADPTVAPLDDTDFSGLPPTVIFTADCDPLRDDGREYRDRLVSANSPAHWVNEDGLVHGYLRARSQVDRAHESFERITVAIEALGQGIWPYD